MGVNSNENIWQDGPHNRRWNGKTKTPCRLTQSRGESQMSFWTGSAASGAGHSSSSTRRRSAGDRPFVSRRQPIGPATVCPIALRIAGLIPGRLPSTTPAHHLLRRCLVPSRVVKHGQTWSGIYCVYPRFCDESDVIMSKCGCRTRRRAGPDYLWATRKPGNPV